MDVSETYIKMCNCPEIQGYWKPDFGDWYVDMGDVQIAPIIGTEEYNRLTSEIRTHKPEYAPVWTPRQDQIQEMIKDLISKRIEYQHCCYCYVEMISKFASSPSCLLPIGTSMEQLWLAFYMYEKHGKIWDKGGWKKIGANRKEESKL